MQILNQRCLEEIGITSDMLTYLNAMGATPEEVTEFIRRRFALEKIEQQIGQRMSLLSDYYRTEPAK